jgi:hypothetical protein
MPEQLFIHVSDTRHRALPQFGNERNSGEALRVCCSARRRYDLC